MQKENQKYLETSKNGNTIYQNLWNTAKLVVRGNLIKKISTIKKNSNKQPKFIPQGLKRRTNLIQS